MGIVQESVQCILSEHSHDWYNYHLHLTHMSDEEYREFRAQKKQMAL